MNICLRIIPQFVLNRTIYRIKGFLSVDVDVSELQVNQCSSPRSKDQLYTASMSADKYYDEIFSQIEIFHDSNKCHPHTMTVRIPFIFKFIQYK